MARYMGGPRGRREPSPPVRAPPSPRNEVTANTGKEDNCGLEETASGDDQSGSSSHQNIQARQRIAAHGGGDDNDDEYEPEESDNDDMETGQNNVFPRSVQNRQNCRLSKEAPLFPRLPISSRNVGEAEDHKSLSAPSEERQSKYRKVLQRRIDEQIPGIIPKKTKTKTKANTKSKSSGKFIFQPLPLPISYGWMVKGTNEHVEDLHLSGILFCDSEVQSKTEVEVLCEYTWIQVTPGQEKTGGSFPSIYVPGNTRNWKGLKLGSSLNQADICTAISNTIRDENTALQPQYPYEPTFRALELTNADLSFRDIDIVTDAETLTQLLAFICGPRACESPITQPFRLDLSTVQDTLFIIPKVKPGRGHTGPLPKHERPDPVRAVPEWAAHVLGRLGSSDPELPYSGGHYRLVRYRFGDVMLAVRVKVDLVYEHRKTPTRSACDPPYGVTTEFSSAPMSTDDIPICKTIAKAEGFGTKPESTGMATVRYLSQGPKSKLNEMIPLLWFSRTAFLVEGVVNYPALEVQEASLIDSRQYYKSFERGHRCSLRHLAGLLTHLQHRTRELDGNAVMVCDPVQVCFVILKPVIKTKPVPKDVVSRFWRPDENYIPASRTHEVSTPEPGSDLTEFSKTPTPPQGSHILKIGKSEGCTSPDIDEDAGDGSTTVINRQRVLHIDPTQGVDEWQSVEDDGYEPDIEDSPSTHLAGDDLGTATPAEDIAVGESVYQNSRGFRDANDEKSFEDHEEQGINDEFSSGGRYRQGVPAEERGCQRSDDRIEAFSDDVSGNVRMPVAGAQEEQRSWSDDENDLMLDGATTTGGVHRYQSSSVDESSANAAHVQLPCQSHPNSISAASNYGAATPHMDQRPSSDDGHLVAQFYTDEEEVQVQPPARTPEYHLVTSTDEDRNTPTRTSRIIEIDAMDVENDASNDDDQSGVLGTASQSGPSIRSSTSNQLGHSDNPRPCPPDQLRRNSGLGAAAYAALRDEERRRLIGNM